ncbi:MAG: DUF262 domain-containing protein [Bacteroidales bacterium]|nr:DUF262 domain-containing protein [Bacteroidales bacterium]
MKYYLCKVGAFQGGGEEEIINDCLRRNVYQYHESTAQKGAGSRIDSGDTLILVYKTQIFAYGIVSSGRMKPADGYEPGWLAVSVKQWIKIDKGKNYPLPYGVFWHTLVGNKQSVVKEIDALWANEIILNITIRNEQEMGISAPALYLHLSTIAAFYQNGLISMPAVQRGKVWNAVRCEVLWDSLLRKIPIGSISLRQSLSREATWELFDGQQRVNAINMGFQKFLPSGKFDQRQPILWLDLAPSAQATEHEDGKIRKSERKFFFRVTTAAHPWGYKLSDNETRNSVLSAGERRKAVENIKDKWIWTEHQGERPNPYELWPVDAEFPVPFPALREFCEQNPQGTFERFWAFCSRSYGATNWFTFFDKEEKISKVNQDNWLGICGAIDKMGSYVVVAQNASNFDGKDVGLYFRRMNKAGVIPGDDEIRYSLLKSKVPVLKELDTLAENRMPPAVLANIAMLSFLDREKWASSLSFSGVSNLADNETFRQYIIGGEIKNLITKIESWLWYSEQFHDGLPRCLYSSIAKSQRDFYRLLLFFAAKWRDGLERRQLVAVVTLVCWYSSDCGKMARFGYSLYEKCDNTPEDWVQCTKQWLTTSAREGWLIPPPPASAYPTDDISFASILSQIDISGYASSIYRTWAWDGYPGRALLLYVCREYLNEQFPNYDPSEAVWSEENRPWDYDHIFPRNWLISGKGNKQGQYHNIVARFINSIGNIAPIHFSTNRSKNDDCPGEYQGEQNKSLFINHQEFFNKSRKGSIEQKKEYAEQFVKITLERIKKLYDAWHSELAIDSFFDFRDKRRELFESIKSKLEKDYPGIGVYFVSGERQFRCQCNADWARPWLAVGVVTQSDFVAVASNGNQIEVGLRRRPESADIEGKNIWWRNNQCDTSHNFGEDNLEDKLIEELKTLLAKVDNQDT